MSKRNKNKNRHTPHQGGSQDPAKEAPIQSIQESEPLTDEEIQQAVAVVSVEPPQNGGVPVEVPELNLDDKPKVNPEKVDPKIRSNVDAAKSARELIEIVKEDYPEAAKNPRFWEVLRDESIVHAGYPQRYTEDMKPMSADRVKEFLKEEFPYGQYAGRKVSFVLKKDPQYLIRFSNSPHPFQKDVRRFLTPKNDSKKQEEKKK